jgi:hypothetical protein
VWLYLFHSKGAKTRAASFLLSDAEGVAFIILMSRSLIVAEGFDFLKKLQNNHKSSCFYSIFM